MGLRMPTPYRRLKSGNFYFRRRVPADIQRLGMDTSFVLTLPALDGAREFTVVPKIGHEVKFSLRTRDEQVAKARSAFALARLASHYDALRKGPTPLSHKQIVALSGEVFHFFRQKYEENPGKEKNWTAVKAFNRAALEGRLLNVPPLDESIDRHHLMAGEIFGDNLTYAINQLPETDDPEALEQRFGRMTDWVLSEKALSITAEDRKKLLKEIGKASSDAAISLRRMARGDYSPDPVAERFPKFEAAPSLTLQQLMERWIEERKPAVSSVSAVKTAIASLSRHLGHSDVHRITDTDVIAWKDVLVSEGKAARTINDSYLAMPKSLFNHGIANKLVRKNPFDGVRVAARQQAGSSRLTYTNEEVASLLKIAKEKGSEQQRWLIWLAAATGARIGELAQLWGDNIEKIDGIWVVQIRPAPDGGTIKNVSSERTVPLHPDLIAEGFLDFVNSKGKGPLFYRRTSGKPGSRHASKGVTNRLAAWIRKQGFTDTRKAPAHAFRHWWKTAAINAKVEYKAANRLQGHADSNVADVYIHHSLDQLHEFVCMIELPGVSSTEAADESSEEQLAAAE